MTTAPRRTSLTLPARRAVAASPVSSSSPHAFEVVQLLVLAHEVERATDRGEATRAQVARSLGLTRARLTQICLLAFLAPDIQAEIVERAAEGWLTERCLRSVAGQIDWTAQRRAWARLRQQSPSQGRRRHSRRHDRSANRRMTGSVADDPLSEDVPRSGTAAAPSDRRARRPRAAP